MPAEHRTADTPATEDPGVTHDRSERTAAANDRAMLRALVIAAAVGLALDLLVVLVALVAADGPAVRGSLVGTGLALIVTLPTLVSARVGMRYGPSAMAAAVMGAWLAKMIVLVAVLIWVRGSTGIDPVWIGVALLVGAVASAIVEALLLLRTRPRLEVR